MTRFNPIGLGMVLALAAWGCAGGGGTAEADAGPETVADLADEAVDAVTCADKCTAAARQCGELEPGCTCGQCAANELCNAEGECEKKADPCDLVCGQKCGLVETCNCGDCLPGFACDAGTHECMCLPTCADPVTGETYECGPDGCGAECGQCPLGAACDGHACPADCGDGACGLSEDCQACPQDCGECPATCGDSECDAGETCASCQADCGLCPVTCGDGKCADGETCADCVPDCGACPVVCGDGECGGAETCGTCADDCGACPPECGDGGCDAGIEDCQTCPGDCGLCPAVCGDWDCEDDEDCVTCSVDCGACVDICGNWACEGAESCLTCEEDCGACPDPCGDDVCAAGAGETCLTCPDDCGGCPTCGNGECDPEESCAGCPEDCECLPECGDGECNGDETCATCDQDCGGCAPVCGDGFCAGDETCGTCGEDCGACPPVCGDGECNGAETCGDCPGDCGACPPTCGNGDCQDGEDCQTCPGDCGACPPKVVFDKAWNETLTGPIVQGGQLRISYDMDRLPDCRATHNGMPGWTILVYYTFDLAQPAQSVQVVTTNTFTNQVIPFEPVIEIPGSAENVWFWANNTDVNGCSTWDSDFGSNYLFPVFSAATLSQDVGWAGSFNFVWFTEAGPALKGDVDPAYYFAVLGGSEVATWVQIEVWIPGVTDRVYQNASVTAQVGKTAVAAVTVTEAYEGSQPGAAVKPVPMEYWGKTGNNFVYRWFPAPLTWGEGFPAAADGAYKYRFELKTAAGAKAWIIGKTGDDAAWRTMVLAKQIECGLFPANPPADLCP